MWNPRLQVPWNVGRVGFLNTEFMEANKLSKDLLKSMDKKCWNCDFRQAPWKGMGSVKKSRLPALGRLPEKKNFLKIKCWFPLAAAPAPSCWLMVMALYNMALPLATNCQQGAGLHDGQPSQPISSEGQSHQGPLAKQRHGGNATLCPWKWLVKLAGSCLNFGRSLIKMK